MIRKQKTWTSDDLFGDVDAAQSQTTSKKKKNRSKVTATCISPLLSSQIFDRTTQVRSVMPKRVHYVSGESGRRYSRNKCFFKIPCAI